MLKKIALLFLLVVAGCASIKSETRIESNLRVKEFNSISSRYMDRPTFITLYELSGDDRFLYVQSDSYRPNKSNTISYGLKYVDEYIAFIDKFLEWEKLATERKDTLNKDIGETSSWAGALNLKFSFYSGNSRSHFLEVAGCGLMCVDTSPFQYFDQAAAKELRSLLIKMKENQFKPTDDSVYK
ncbi:hypothetical protein BOO22_14595 [Vibrio cidicii]|uniref:hypothetical protein n=1 Tax=Vibrio cidicii TaxID=1763883 RepID=UPI0018C1EEDD|nr:hypothetical protein [Vibrio cidicii]MBG0760640.1 hypothetical protein [Vibrio cidicii]MCU8263020.1 hypothetical protein [Vibrio vulnificus]MCU8486130.1 hypothetical protein [Vibrio vulnificus]